MSKSSEFIKILKERKETIGKCELCGSKRSLELHHCIPKVLGGQDTDSNLILLCGTCHAKLTPRIDLIRIGKWIKRAKKVVVDNSEFYEVGCEKAKNGQLNCACDVYDLFDNLSREAVVFYINEK